MLEIKARVPLSSTSFNRDAAVTEARRYWCAAVLALLALVAVTVDRPLAQWFLAGNSPYWIKKICALGEVFGHGLGVALFLVAILVLDPANRRSVVRVSTMAFGAGLFANVFKLWHRPLSAAQVRLQRRRGDTFSAWLPLGSAGSGQQLSLVAYGHGGRAGGRVGFG